MPRTPPRATTIRVAVGGAGPQVYNALRRWQEHHVFSVHQVDLPADRRGFWGYLFLYQALSSVASLRGDAQYLIGAGRQWK